MVRNTIAVGVACFYVALSAWLVQREGAAYRSALLQARESRLSSQPVVPERSSVTDHAPKADVAATRVTASPDPSEVRDKAATAAPASPPAKPAGEPSRPGPKPGLSVVLEVKPVAPLPAEPHMLKPAGPTTVESLRAKLDPFWLQPEVTRKWELSNLSAQDEMRLGSELHDMIMHFNQRVQSGPWLERVEAAAKPILARRARKDIEYTFTILDSAAINAFSHPGGHVYLYRGLFPFLGEDEEAALQFVLAHEIAHVDLRHTIQCLRDPGVEKVDMGTLEKVYILILPLGYLDKQEYAADEWAYQQLMRLDQSRYDALKFLRKLKAYSQAHEFYDGRAPYKPTAGSSPVENHLRAHTAAWRRLNHLDELTSPAAKITK